MQYRCHDCGELFETPHTNYKHARGYHPSDNPTHSADVAKDFDHCTNCQSQRKYDPVAARTRDLATSSGAMHSPALDALNKKIATLQAQVAQAETEKAARQDLATQVEVLSKKLSSLQPVPVTA